jgi:hypothetical protein
VRGRAAAARPGGAGRLDDSRFALSALAGQETADRLDLTISGKHARHAYVIPKRPRHRQRWAVRKATGIV